MTDEEEEIIQIEGELQEAESDLGDTLSDVSASVKAAMDQVRLGLRPRRSHPEPPYRRNEFSLCPRSFDRVQCQDFRNRPSHLSSFGGIGYIEAFWKFSRRRARQKQEEVKMSEQDAVTLLKKDHAAAKQLFEQEEHVTKKDGSGKASIFIKAALEVHATIEEEIFYPAVKQARSEQVKDEVREGYEEHKQIKSLLAQISSITPADETYDMKIKVLKEDVEHHVKDEEGEMFPDAKKFVGKTRLLELGRELEARKQQLEKNRASKPALANQSTKHTK
jgi:iron-sulfur cluster repair protein YtfE (RIC family)